MTSPVLHQLYKNISVSPVTIRIALSHANIHQVMDPMFYDNKIDEMLTRSENVAGIKLTMKLEDFMDMEHRLSVTVAEKQQREADPRLMELYTAYQTLLHLMK